MGILYGRLPDADGQVEWFHVSHLESDGIGGFARMLEKQGIHVTHLPSVAVPCRGVIGPLWRYWQQRRGVTSSVRRQDWSQQPVPPHQIPGDRAWHLFSEAQTQALLEACRRENITVTSLLLKLLDDAVRPQLGIPDAAIPWMVPVNMRSDGRVGSATCYANHVSCIDVLVAPQDTPQGIHRQLRDRLERGEHRATCLLMGLGKFFSQKCRQRLLARDRAKSTGTVGAFSNLGNWSPPGSQRSSDGWLFCPPLGGGQRLAAGCVTFQGRLGLVIQAHPDPVSGEKFAQGWLARWLDLISAQVQPR